MKFEFDSGAIARRLLRLYPRNTIRRELQVATVEAETTVDLHSYKLRPRDYCKDILGVDLTPDQGDIAHALPGRVKVNSGHNLGKTFLAACLVHWWFYTRDPAVVITTAPTERDVIDLLWTEVRLLHARAKVSLPNYFIGPRAPEMFHHEEHKAKGYTARSGESFQGRHRPSMFFLFDECEDVDPIYWQTTDTMYQPGEDHAWLAIGNPITTSSQSYLEDLATGPDGQPKWKLFTLSSLNHPNIKSQLTGGPVLIQNAVTLHQVEQWIQDWCDPVPVGEAKKTDIEWPPSEITKIPGKWYRPGPMFKARVLGVRPTEGVDTVWSEAAWVEATTPKFDPHDMWMHQKGITIGVDVAVYGDDSTVIHVRTGPLSLHHESHNGWGPGQTAGRIKELSREWCNWYNSLAVIPDRPKLELQDVKTVIEVDGPGVAVLSHCHGFGDWSGLKVAERSEKFDNLGRAMYPNKRSQMWFDGADLAIHGKMDLSRLPKDVLARLRLQLMTPAYWLMPNGTRQVESKEDIKKRLKRSPDDADGLLVAFAEMGTWSPSIILKGDSPD